MVLPVLIELVFGPFYQVGLLPVDGKQNFFSSPEQKSKPKAAAKAKLNMPLRARVIEGNFDPHGVVHLSPLISYLLSLSDSRSVSPSSGLSFTPSKFCFSFAPTVHLCQCHCV